MEENYGIKETMDTLEAIKVVLAAVQSAKADGQINNVDYFQIVVTASPAILVAVNGADKIPKELSDLSEDELQELRDEGYSDMIENENVVRAIYHFSGLADAIYEWYKESQELQS